MLGGLDRKDKKNPNSKRDNHIKTLYIVLMFMWFLLLWDIICVHGDLRYEADKQTSAYNELLEQFRLKEEFDDYIRSAIMNSLNDRINQHTHRYHDGKAVWDGNDH